MPVISTAPKRNGEICRFSLRKSQMVTCGRWRLSSTVIALAIVAGACWAQTSDQSGPESFIKGIYARYAAKATYSSLGSDRKEIYSHGLNRLIEADRKRTPVGFQGMIDADPLCDRQDSDGLKVVQLTSLRTRKNQVDTAVTLQVLRNSSSKTTVQLKLIHTPSGWRVDDVSPYKGLSLRQLLTSPHA